MSERVVIRYVHHLDQAKIVISSQRPVSSYLLDGINMTFGVEKIQFSNRYNVNVLVGSAFAAVEVAAAVLQAWVNAEGVAIDNLEVVEQGFPEGISIAHKARRWHRLDRIGELTRRIEDLASEIRLNNAVLKRQRADLRTLRQELEELCAEELEELDDPVVETSESIDPTADNESSDES